MTIEEAIRTAIEQETRIHSLYAGAAQAAVDEVGKSILQLLAEEEKQHLDHLRTVLDRLKRTGRVTDQTLQTVIPSKKAIRGGIGKLKARMSDRVHRPAVGGRLEVLREALEAEIETGSFYKRMVSDLGEEGQQVFARFVEIEEGHRVLVQAEMDHLAGAGFWFDFREFDQEQG